MNILVSVLFLLCGWVMIWSQARVRMWSLNFWIILFGGFLVMAGGALLVILSESQP